MFGWGSLCWWVFCRLACGFAVDGGIFVVTLVLFCCVACGFGLLWRVLCGWDFSVAGAGGLLILVYSFDVCRFPYLLCFGMLIRLI